MKNDSLGTYRLSEGTVEFEQIMCVQPLFVGNRVPSRSARGRSA